MLKSSPPDSSVGVAPLLPGAVRVVVAEAVVTVLVLGVVLRARDVGGGGRVGQGDSWGSGLGDSRGVVLRACDVGQ